MGEVGESKGVLVLVLNSSIDGVLNTDFGVLESN